MRSIQEAATSRFTHRAHDNGKYELISNRNTICICAQYRPTISEIMIVRHCVILKLFAPKKSSKTKPCRGAVDLQRRVKK